ncbi:synaptojanin-1 isoform X2 [Phymastichus coffea]|nr:synaptojanin-1 isoform X2 [Phymastichus coffea]
MITSCYSVGKIYDSEIFRITQTNFIPLHYIQNINDDRIAEVRKVLNSGTFYFSWSSGTDHPLDITLSAQQRYAARCTDNRFFWNRMLHIHLLRFGVNTDIWLLKAVCGSVEIRTVYVGHRQARAVLISRLSCERAGTRFNVRGTNDDGHVANFVETEQIIYLDNEVSSYIQTRGSIPLFWEQPGIQVGSHKVKISRGFECSAPAFDRHFKLLKNRYGNQVIVNLLASNFTSTKEGEALLSQLFQDHQNSSNHTDMPHILFDYHQECRAGNIKNLMKLKDKVSVYMDEFSFFHSIGQEILKLQNGTIRTNCLDCLDRTNCVQTFLALEILQKQLIALKLNEKQQIIARFDEVFRQMWINNGNEISKIYAGTGAIQGSSKIMDGARSAARTIQNNLLDSNKQEAIDILLLGSALNTELADRARLLLSPSMLHAPSSVLKEMCKRHKDYTDIKNIRVGVATYNVNGGKHFRSVVYKDVTLSDWLLDAYIKSSKFMELSHGNNPVDIFAIGFEEIVDLNASNIVATSSENAKAWADELQKVLSRDHEYVLLTYQQLVGVCLYIFIRPMYVEFLRDVAVDSVKTGLGGATGNKGACAIRFVLYSTSFCFVCAHFAAGQSQVNERNADYAEITRRIIFPMGRTLNAHDYVFWCGDFNYRVDINKDEMKEMLKKNEISHLLKYDQLNIQKQQGNVFKNFIEGPIDFLPTYKYDLFSDDYDTSEKCRQPAWTDRVLWKRRKFLYNDEGDEDWNIGKLIYYGRGELKQSDHRPVVAIVDIEIQCTDQLQRCHVFRQVIQNLGPPDGTVIIQLDENKHDVENIIETDFMNSLVQNLSEIGEILLVRFVNDTIWVTFRDGQSALAAVQKGTIAFYGNILHLTLKSPDWVPFVEKEIDYFKNDEILHENENLNIEKGHMNYYSKNFQNPLINPSHKSPPPRPVPPSKSSTILGTNIDLIQKSVSVEKHKASVEESTIHEEITENISSSSISDHTNISSSENVDKKYVNAPPLPMRQLPLPPPRVPPPVLPSSIPPPIPARSSTAPPVPARNNI